MFSGFRWSSNVYLSPWLLRTSMRAMFCRIRWQPINPWTKMQSRYVTFFFPSFSCVHFKCQHFLLFFFIQNRSKSAACLTLCAAKRCCLNKEKKYLTFYTVFKNHPKSLRWSFAPNWDIFQGFSNTVILGVFSRPLYFFLESFLVLTLTALIKVIETKCISEVVLLFLIYFDLQSDCQWNMYSLLADILLLGRAIQKLFFFSWG